VPAGIKEGKFKEHEKAFLFRLFVRTYVLIQDPAMARDIYITHNKETDKNGFIRDITSGLFGESFLFSKAD